MREYISFEDGRKLENNFFIMFMEENDKTSTFSNRVFHRKPLKTTNLSKWFNFDKIKINYILNRYTAVKEKNILYFTSKEQADFFIKDFLINLKNY